MVCVSTRLHTKLAVANGDRDNLGSPRIPKEPLLDVKPSWDVSYISEV